MVYVDRFRSWSTVVPDNGIRVRFETCRLTADSKRELLAFATRMGLPDEWFQDHHRHPHFDLSASWRAKAVRLGATEIGDAK